MYGINLFIKTPDLSLEKSITYGLFSSLACSSLYCYPVFCHNSHSKNERCHLMNISLNHFFNDLVFIFYLQKLTLFYWKTHLYHCCVYNVLPTEGAHVPLCQCNHVREGGKVSLYARKQGFVFIVEWTNHVFSGLHVSLYTSRPSTT